MKAAIYLRQSLDRDNTGEAVDRQRSECTALCERRGWEPLEYVDNDVSASNGRVRPAYQQMLADVERGAVGGVVVWDLDRLHRQPRELEDFIILADRHDLQLATVSGDVDLSTDNGRLYARIKGAVAKSEMDQKSRRQKSSHAQRRASGKGWTTRRPFGFEDGGLNHDLIEAPILRRMYIDALEGVSQTQIARTLNDHGIRTTLKNQWSQGAVRLLLLNPRNAGLITYGGEVVGTAEWEPIISEDIFQAVKSKFGHTQKGGGGRKYPLVGVAACGVCGTKARSMQTSRGVRMYSCPNYHVGRKAESLEAFVFYLVTEWLRRPAAVDLLASDDNTAGDLAAEAKSIRARMDSLTNDWADDDTADVQMLKTAFNRLKDRLADVEARMGRTGQSSVLGAVLAAPDPGDAFKALDAVRQGLVIDRIMSVTINRTRKGARFDPSSIGIEWR